MKRASRTLNQVAAVAAAMAVAAVAASAAGAVPSSGGCELFPGARTTIGGGYRVTVLRCPPRIAVGDATMWTIRVVPRVGAPQVRRLDVGGGMPEHGHGFLTPPAVTRTGTVGDFRTRLVFAMPGRWVIELRIVARGRRELVRYQLTL
jgi:hypothetical protein